jgi:hypothetical protein
MLRIPDPNGHLLCPEPGCPSPEWTHIDSVVIRSRPHEDGPVAYREMHANGGVSTFTEDDDPFTYKNDRRSTFILMVQCEAGHTFAVRFRQHKGHTEVDAKAKGWR